MGEDRERGVGPFNAIAAVEAAPADLSTPVAVDGGPPVSADGLPVPRRASAALAYPLAFVTLACGASSTGVGITTLATRRVPGLVASIVGFAAAALAYGGTALLLAKVSPERGGRGRTVATVGFVLGFIGFFHPERSSVPGRNGVNKRPGLSSMAPSLLDV